ncbi:HD domain-containing protein [Candidatus Micrarchaeota archaeon]|nr:HD domain-containing protein [Candidatus Micrarchaeota archaeon]
MIALGEINPITERGWLVLSELEKFMKNDENDPAHDLNHHLRVRKTGIEIGKSVGADLEVLEPALLLHDVIRPKEEAKEKTHAQESAKEAERILKKCGYRNEEIKRICNTIRNHSRTDLSEGKKDVESKVLYDADKIDGVGADGIRRVISLGKTRGWNAKKSAAWYLGRILDVAKNERLYFASSKAIAREGITISLNWCERVLGKEKFAKQLNEGGFHSAGEVEF